MGPNVDGNGKVLSFSILVGFFVLCRYFASEINFVPVGLRLEDYLIFALSGVVFGALYTVWLLLGFSTCAGISYVVHNRPLATLDKTYAGMLVFASLFALAVLGYAYWVTDDFLAVFIVVCSGAIFCLYLEQLDNNDSSLSDKQIEQRSRNQKVALFLAVVLPAVLGTSVIDRFISKAIDDLGYSKKRVSLLISDANMERVRAYSKFHGLPIFGCSYESNLENVIHNFDVKWHGVGEKSLVQGLIPVYSSDSDKRSWKSLPNLVLDYEGLEVLPASENRHADHGSPYSSCISIGSDSLFDTNSSVLNPLGEKRLEELIYSLNQYVATGNLKIKLLEIVGYADRRKISKGSNLELSEKRALSVKDKLFVALDGAEDSVIVSSGMGDLIPISDCSYEMKGQQLEDCLSVDRRIDIRIIFTL